MGRRIGIVTAWVIATVVSVAVAAQAVGLVRDRVIERPSPVVEATAALQHTSTTASTTASLTASTVPGTSPQATTTTGTLATSTTAPAATTTTGTVDTSLPPVSSSVTTPSTTAAQTTTSTPPSTTTAPTTTPPTTTPPTTTPPTTTPPTTTTQPPPPPTTTTTTTVPDMQFAVYELVGGFVQIRHGNGDVWFDGASPRPGFSVEIEETGPEKVEVEFESSDHTSKFKAFYDDGELVIDRDEEDESDD